MKYCILGGGGAFGIHTAKHILEDDGAEVVGIGRNPLRPEPFRLGVTDHRKYTYKQFHISHDFEFLTEFLSSYRPDVIVNFAAQGEGAVSWRHSARFFDTNGTALVQLYEWLTMQEWATTGDVNFVHIGTSELYGSVHHPAWEDAPIRPSSPYAASKAAFDLYLLAMAQQGWRPRVTILRPCNCYCSGQLLHRIIPRALVSAVTGRKVPLHGGGQARKTYMHVSDLARAIVCAARRPDDTSNVFNLGPSLPVSIRDVAERCARVANVHFDNLFDIVGERTGQDGQYWLNSTTAWRELMWEPSVDLTTGVEEVYQWVWENRDTLSEVAMTYELRS